MSDYSGYAGKSLDFLKSNGIGIGDRVLLTVKMDYEGIIMPRFESDVDDVIVLKLKNGYNVGVRIDGATVKKLPKPEERGVEHAENAKPDNSLAKILLVSTGGTIASKIDYRTGAVTPVLSPEELRSSVPELAEIANIDVKTILSEHSENIVPENWVEIAKFLDGIAESEYAGIIMAHGTDTMQYTASYLAFALQGFPIPIVLTGSQRSSDRPSSDAAPNLIGSAKFLASNPTPGIFVAMHQSGDGHDVAVHLATRVRKNHTSKRGAFETVGDEPAYVVTAKTIEKNTDGDFSPKKKYSPSIAVDTKVGLVKYHPGLDPGIIDHMVNSGCRALILEGTGLGHVGRTAYDSVKNASRQGVFLGMTSQCIGGTVNMNVYESGRDLQKMGVVPLSGILPETALVKAMWAMGNADSAKGIKDIMTKNIAHEFA